MGGGGQIPENPYMKQSVSNQSCLACDHNVIRAVRMDAGPSGPWRTPIRESNMAIARDERVYNIGSSLESNTIHLN